MKKKLLVAIAILLSLGQLSAAPVDVNTAQSLGNKFLRNNVESLRAFKDSKHVFTLKDDEGNACLYVFNIDEKGFYIVAADDRAKPILAYSDESRFDMDNIPSGMEYYLQTYKDAISYVIKNDLDVDAATADEWKSLKTRGVLPNRGYKSVEPLVDLLWDQEYPYNYYCPTDYYGPGGHVYAGCVADAMAMVMKYWNYPDAAVGEHSYTPPGYPTQSVTFGEEYDWENMPKQLNSYSSMTQIEAVAKLMYHCGVSVDMQYGYDGSGTYSSEIPQAMKNYFKYNNKTYLSSKSSFTKDDWEDKLINNFDQGFPIIYGGYSEQSGGHSFLCDGYDENKYFHFNWGWSGWCNGYFSLDALNPSTYNFSSEQSCIFDLIPLYKYEAMPAAPEIMVSKENSHSHKGTVTVIVPTTTENKNTLTSLQKLVIMREGTVIHTENNPTPGETITIDDIVPDYDEYTYYAYAVNEDVKGRFAKGRLQYGPTCEWELVCTTTNFKGWNDGKLKFVNANGKVFEEFTMESSSTVNKMINMPEGDVSLEWCAPKSEVKALMIIVKNPSGETVYQYSGASTGLEEGVLKECANTCEDCKAPTNFTGEPALVNATYGSLLKWNHVTNPNEYKVYRSNDNVEYKLIATVHENEYFDVTEIGTYYYRVTSNNSNCESTPAMTADNEMDYVVVDVTSIKENYINALVFPNPSSGIVTIKADGLLKVCAYNALGQKLLENDADIDEYVLDMQHFQPGVYMIKIVTDRGETTQRVTLMD